MTTLDDFYGNSSAGNTPMLCPICHSDNLAGNHRGMECCDCGGKWSPELQEEDNTLCLKEDSKGNWQPLFSEGFM